MFKKIRQKLSGALTYDELMKKCDAYINVAMDDEGDDSIYVRIFRKNQNHLKAWKELNSDNMKRVANSSNRTEQLLNLRGEIVKEIEASCMCQPYIDDEFSEEEKKILGERFNKDLSYDDMITYNQQLYVYSQASCKCMRMIAFELGDARKNDWFDMYCDLYPTLVEQIYRATIDDEKSDVYIFGPLIKALKEQIEGIKQKILQGYNWDNNKEEIEEERRREEAEAEAEEKRKEPPLQKNVTPQQFDLLTEYLFERYERLRNGELYKIYDYSPLNPLSAIQIDTGLMLIALCECLENNTTAINSIQTVLYNFAKKLKPEEDCQVADIDLSEQLYLKEFHEENKEEGWLGHVCIMATCYLYDINLEDFNEDEKRLIGESSFENMKDAWEVYAKTKNFFGWDYEEYIFD
jgi:hypothetical protein